MIAMRLALLSLLICTHACDTGTRPPDEPPGPIDGSLMTITADVRDLGAPAPDVRVIFHRRDGTVVSTTTTDAAGVASGLVPPDGMITAVSAARGLRRVVSVAGLSPDERIAFDLPDVWGSTWDEYDPGPVVGTVDVLLPEIVNASGYQVFLGCTDAFLAEPSSRVDVPERCVSQDDTIHIQAIGWYNGKPVYPVGFTYAGDIPFQRGGTTSVTLPPWDTQNYATTRVPLTDAPPGSVTVRVTGGMRAGGLPFAGDAANGMASAVLSAGDDVELELDYLADFGDGVDITVALEHTTGRSHWTALDHPRTDELPVDLSVDLLPPILSYQVDDMTDWQRPQLTWELARPLAGADGMFVMYHWLLPDTTDLYWFLMAPPDWPASATFPELPAELAEGASSPVDDFRPPGPDHEGISVFYQGVYAFDADWVDGHDDLKRTYGPGFLTHAALPPGPQVIRYTWGGVMFARTYVGRRSE